MHIMCNRHAIWVRKRPKAKWKASKKKDQAHVRGGLVPPKPKSTKRIEGPPIGVTRAQEALSLFL